MERPKIHIELKPVDIIIEVIGLIALLLLIFLPIFHFSELPPKIPTHFNALGQPDSYGSRNIILLLPLLGILLYSGLTILNRFPHIFNYPVPISNNNAERLYIIGTRTIRFLKTIIVILFLFITYQSIYISLGKAKDLGLYFLPIFTSLISIVVFIMIYKMFKKK
ncbi:MAG: DUF1648 domain-containing protein [Tenuifilaceae bacterium]